jgi:hypothetical protein
LELRDGDYNEWQGSQLFTWTCTNQTTNWLVRTWSTFGAHMNHKHTRIHKIHHNVDSVVSFLEYFLWLTTGLHPNVILSYDSPVESLKILKIGTFATWKAHNFLCRPSIEMKFKEKL